MFTTFLKHDWLALRRSPILDQQIGQSIALGIIGLYMIVSFLGLAFYLPEVIAEYFPDQPLMAVVNQFFIYYILSDLATRFFIQKFPSLNIGHYLTHNIRKSQICSYLCTRSIFNYFNLLPLFLLLPFYFRTVTTELESPQSVYWLLMCLLFIGINHFLVFFLDKSLGTKTYLSMAIIAIIATGGMLDYYGYFSLGSLFAPIFEFLYTNAFGLLLPLAIVSGLALLVFKLFRANAFLDLEEDAVEVSGLQFGIFDRFGPRLSTLMQQEAKLIWRNKRPKLFLFVSLLFLLYPFFFLSQGLGQFDSYYMLILMGLLLTGAFALNYGQLLLSWNSNHFDFILAQNIRIHDFLESKYLILVLSNLVLYILSLPYVFLFPKMFLANTVMFLFNTGCTIFGYIYLNIQTAKKIDVSKGGTFNHEGLGAGHYLMMIPLMAAPIGIFFLFSMLGGDILGLSAIAFIGILGIVFRKPILLHAEGKLIENKYKLGSRFRK